MTDQAEFIAWLRGCAETGRAYQAARFVGRQDLDIETLVSAEMIYNYLPFMLEAVNHGRDPFTELQQKVFH